MEKIIKIITIIIYIIFIPIKISIFINIIIIDVIDGSWRYSDGIKINKHNLSLKKWIIREFKTNFFKNGNNK